ncbi:efflux RND transporter permease subunit [Alloalcanivorax xenomutans]|uniref:efflux RND transporter permease subunit n=1 Tax=Alloalcanivorax xenomutans TaxID=1094342 RepID=UPI0024E25834|nr:efflux RND transporter permease subunit [Alloalcanivorax xenomutans]
MKFTDIFINKPVLASVVSLFIFLLGLRAATELNVRQYPELENAVITVTTIYTGADADLIQGFITTPLEQEIASANGIDYLVSTSLQGASSIQAYVRLGQDPNETLTQIVAKVNKMRSELPEESEDPTVELAIGDDIAAMYLSFSSEVLDNNQITDYLVRVVQPKLATINGVQRARILGDRTFAMRAWLKPERMAALGITPSDVYAALEQNNVLAAVGSTKGTNVALDLKAETDLNDVAGFRRLVIRAQDNAIVRLEDVADVELGSESYAASVTFNGQKATFMGIEVAPDANSLDVIAEVRKVLEDEIFPQMPEGLEGNIPYDGTEYIQDSIDEVVKTLVEAVIIVILVIYLFLGSLRSVLIPAIAVPLSMVGALFLMLLMGFSINLLTLLAMVLAIGMVVDDAIIVLENIHRHIEEGMAPYDAAIKGARELVGPVIAMTITLMAVFAPIGFLSGITGKLFSEFAFTLAGAVLISGVVALTLTPMMCAKILRPTHGEGAAEGGFAAWLDARFERWREAYKRRLHGALDTKVVIAVFGAIVFASCYFLFISTPGELAPEEDIGFAFSINETDGYSSREYLDQYFAEAQKTALAQDNIDHIFTFASNEGGSTNTGFMGLILPPWDDRSETTGQVVNQLLPELQKVAGIRPAVIVPPALPTPGQGYPVEFVLKSTADPQSLYQVGNEIIGRAMASKKFIFLAPRLRIDRPEAVIEVDRDKAAAMGVDMGQLSADLSALLASGEVGRFAYEGRSYKVIPQLQRNARLNPEQLDYYYTRTNDGRLVLMSSVINVTQRATPRTIEHAQQLNSNTLIGVPRPGIPQGEALAILEEIAQEVMPDGFQIDFAGASRQFKQEGSALLATFGFALVIIYLVLAAQFESFRDPLIMLVTVPMSICGALLVLNIFNMTNGMQLSNFPGMTLNIYTQVGLVTLIGVISKHGILIVEFANQLQQQGMPKREAIEEAASIRMRPVLMTTAALVVAMFPLLMADGPGAASRFSMGLIIAAGMTIGTLFTLYVVPAAYMYIGRDYTRDRATAAHTAPPTPVQT